MDKSTSGWMHGFVGMLIFSASLPATRVAVAAFDPVFVTAARATIAGAIGALLLVLSRENRPSSSQLMSLVLVAAGVVVGFPLLSALALTHVTSAHSLVFIGLLPLSTAVFGVVRGGERPKTAFWVFSGIGSLIVAWFSLSQDSTASATGDLLMIGAILVCGFGYAEGAVLSRKLGGWQVICWALVLALPATAVLAVATAPLSVSRVSCGAWLGLGYVSLFSMLIGFFFWYRGLAEGGIAGVGQLQLLQPFFGLVLAATLLDEPVGWRIIGCAAAIVVCVAGAKRFAR